ncbi:MAG: hypothetical protein R3C45_01815 [Phycisphaerales bacterium]
MTHAIFELDQIAGLPLWAQVLIASRIARRAALWLPLDTPTSVREALLAGCDAADRCAISGQRSTEDVQAMQIAANQTTSHVVQPAIDAMYYAADAAHAAESSLDFEAAERACTQSVLKALASAAEMATLNPLQVRIFAAADLDQLRFACNEIGINRYDGLGTAVIGRLFPVTAPAPDDIRPQKPTDPQDEYR